MSDVQHLIPGKLRLDMVERWLAMRPLRIELAEAFWPGVEAAATLPPIISCATGSCRR